jgi:hypothetical protein
MCIVAVIVLVKLINSVREVVAKADEVIDSVESAAEVLKNTGGKLALLKLVSNVMKMAYKGKK